jgi:hypothetical protein
MVSIGSLPKKIGLVSAGYKTFDGRNGLIFPRITLEEYVAYDLSVGKAEAHFKISFPEGIIIPNHPISGLKLIQVWSEKNNTMTVVSHEPGKAIRMKGLHAIEAAMQTSVSGGDIEGNYVWSKLPYDGLSLIRVGSRMHEAILAEKREAMAACIPVKELNAGDVIRTRSGGVYVYLGNFKSREFKWSEGADSFTPIEKRGHLYMRPVDYSLRHLGSRPVNLQSLQVGLDRLLNTPCSTSGISPDTFEWSLRTGSVSAKSVVGRMSLDGCRVAEIVKAAATDVYNVAVENNRTRLNSPIERLYRQRSVAGLMSYYLNITNLNSEIKNNPVFN